VSAHESGSNGLTTLADYWRHIQSSSPGPRIAVAEDLDNLPMYDAFFGKINFNIHRALECSGAITNDDVQDMEEVSECYLAPKNQGLNGKSRPKMHPELGYVIN
jgi:hypothetical protein